MMINFKRNKKLAGDEDTEYDAKFLHLLSEYGECEFKRGIITEKLSNYRDLLNELKELDKQSEELYDKLSEEYDDRR